MSTRDATGNGLLIVLLGAMTAYGPLALNLYLPSLPTIAADLSLKPAEAQSTLSAFLMGMAIGQIFCGPASDRFGRRPLVIAGGAIYIAANVICALADNAHMLLAARFVAGLGGCAGGVVARAVLRDRFDHTETARHLSMMMSIVGVAPILAPSIGGVVILLGGWRLNFWLLAGFGALTTIATVLWLAETRPARSMKQARLESVMNSYRTILREPRLMGYALVIAFNSSALFTYIAASPALLIKSYGLTTAQFGWVFGINAFGIVAGGQINRLLLKHHSPDHILGTSTLISTALAFVLAVCAITGWGGQWSVFGILFLLLSTFAFTVHNSTAGALHVDPQRAGTVSAFLGVMQFAMGAVIVQVSGSFEDGTARPMALAMLCAMGTAAIALNRCRSIQTSR